jgi:hypothetical protein
MATMLNLHFIYDRFNAIGICSSGSYTLKLITTLIPVLESLTEENIACEARYLYKLFPNVLSKPIFLREAIRKGSDDYHCS